MSCKEELSRILEKAYLSYCTRILLRCLKENSLLDAKVKHKKYYINII